MIDFIRSSRVYLLNEIDALLQIHAEVDELPLNAFLAVLLLLEDEHVMVEELLQTLVGVVDTQLLERVVLNTTARRYRSLTDADMLRKLSCQTLSAALYKSEILRSRRRVAERTIWAFLTFAIIH